MSRQDEPGNRSFILRATHDMQSDRSLSTTVVSAVAEANGADAAELPPLYDVIDPGALDALFSPVESSDRRAEASVSFEFAGRAVTVTGDGTVTVRKRA